MNGLQPFCCISYSFGAMPRSILAKMPIYKFKNWHVHNIVLDTYGVIASSPKLFGLDRSKLKVTETAHLSFKGKTKFRRILIMDLRD